MPRGAPQGQLGGTPRHRAGGAHNGEEAFWLGAVPELQSKDADKKARLNGQFIVVVMALALAVMFSVAVFNSSSNLATGWQHHQIEDHHTPLKRHRKLERESQHGEQQQLVLQQVEEHKPQEVAGDSDGGDGQDEDATEKPAATTEDGGTIKGNAADAADTAETTTTETATDVGAGESDVDGGQETGSDADEGDGDNDDVEEAGEQAGGKESTEATADNEDTGGEEEEYSDEPPQQEEGEDEGGQQQQEQDVASSSSPERRKKSAYQLALQRCDTLACLKEAAAKERHPGQFLFPHFLIIGWQKCATTSLFHHLNSHPNVVTPSEKEPEFFSYDCEYDALGCSPEQQQEYIQQTLHLDRALRHNLRRAMFEASTHYAREGYRRTPSGHTFAGSLFEVFPWVKLIASLREPISRYLSMLGHNLDKNTYTCLNKHDSLFECLELELPWNNYTTPLQSWLDVYPREQLLVLQYESLTAEEKEAEHLRTVKSFLGLDPELPANQLVHSNTRANRLGREPEGWPMKKWQYERLIEVVRPDIDSLAKLVDKYKLGDTKEWVANWEKAWQANLDACDADGNCSIH